MFGENELILYWWGFLLLLGIFILLLAILIKLHLDHRELIDVLKNLPVHSHCEEESNPLDKEGDDEK